MKRLFSVKVRQKLVFLAVFTLLLNTAISAQDRKSDRLESDKTRELTVSTATRPAVQHAAHTQGKMQLVVSNNGTFGTEGTSQIDAFTGASLQACVYPKNSDLVYLWVAGLWIGAIVGRDTIVSVADEDFYCTYEFWPEIEPFGNIEYMTIDESSPFFSENAYSEQDLICVYTDTIDDQGITRTDCDEAPHIPLNVKIVQRSMAWSYDYADDFVLFDYEIENIGEEDLKEVYMGIWVDGDVWHVINRDSEHWTDDLVGFYRTHPAPEGCGFVDTVNIAYHTDNDGDPTDGAWDDRSPRSAVGARVVRTPSDSLEYSYNWWIINYGDPSRDFGPRRAETPDDPFRDFGTRLGTPVGDRNKYYVMRHEEFDYDLLYTALDHTGEGWLAPPENADLYAGGFDVRNLLSFGPFDIRPGESLPISFAWIGGDNVHVDPSDFEVFDPYNPGVFYDRLNFTELATNSRWASWIYDNPGVDTDGNGDRGKFRTCCTDTVVTDTGIVYLGCDTTWYEGDGVPDFQGASPPPAPDFWITPRTGALRVRFNGLRSETTPDRFSGNQDFEGYRVYISRDDRPSSYSLVASYDVDNFNKYVYNYNKGAYVLLDPPFTRESLQQLYGDLIGDADFEPLLYTRADPYVHPLYSDSMFYFTPQDYNCSDLGITTPITKVYPDQPYPSSLFPQTAQPDELTEDGYLKYFEYEIEIDSLLPTVPYYLNVTAFDFGSPEVGLSSLESALGNGAQVAYPLTPADEVEERDLKVYVYPNPYRADQGYDTDGFENRDGTEASSRMRRINFANLPRVCKIYIYSIDGDLIRELDHNYPNGGPEAMHDTWNLITRNTQAAVSGLYYWVVESAQGTQMGKFVIIK